MTARRQAGFTLLELLVSLTLLGLLFVLLFGSLRFGMRAWEHSTANTDTTDEVRTVQDLLRAELERACPRRRFTDASTPPVVEFDGTPTAMYFLGPAMAGGPQCMPLSLRAKADGRLVRLVLSRASANGRGESDLPRRAKSIAFSYFAKGSGWSGSWSHSADLPELVRLRVVFPDGDVRIWPELFVAPRISAEADCTYDPATKSCRGS